MSLMDRIGRIVIILYDIVTSDLQAFKMQPFEESFPWYIHFFLLKCTLSPDKEQTAVILSYLWDLLP